MDDPIPLKIVGHDEYRAARLREVLGSRFALVQSGATSFQFEATLKQSDLRQVGHVLFDVWRPDGRYLEDEAIHECQRLRRCVPGARLVIVAPGLGTHFLLQLGAVAQVADCVRGPELDDATVAQIVACIQPAAERDPTPAILPSLAPPNHDCIIGASSAMSRIREAIERYGPTDYNVLITGESGTGKELVAKGIWSFSKRHALPLLSYNCAAWVPTLMASELFGHKKGAFAGADRDREGALQAANGRTLYLDEIGELDLASQAMMLRVLQEKKFYPVGGNKEHTTNFRLIAATNRNLAAECRAGRFRSDLSYRLDVISIYLPSLRERPEDILELSQHIFARELGRATNTEISAASVSIAPAALAKLQAFPWPGNVRQLETAMIRVLAARRWEPELEWGRSITGHEIDQALASYLRDAPFAESSQRSFRRPLLHSNQPGESQIAERAECHACRVFEVWIERVQLDPTRVDEHLLLIALHGLMKGSVSSEDLKDHHFSNAIFRRYLKVFAWLGLVEKLSRGKTRYCLPSRLETPSDARWQDARHEWPLKWPERKAWEFDEFRQTHEPLIAAAVERWPSVVNSDPELAERWREHQRAGSESE